MNSVKHILGVSENLANVDLLTEQPNGWFDAYGLNSGQVQIISTSGITSGQIIFEQTNDSTLPNGVPLQVNEVNTNVIQSAAINVVASSNKIYQFAITCRYIRVRVATVILGGGTVKAAAYLSEQPISSLTTLIAPQSGATSTPVSVSAALPAGGNTIGNVGAINGALPAGANQIGDVGSVYRANATGAATARKIIAVAGTNATNIKNSGGRLIGWTIANLTASWKYVKFYNVNVAPTVGTTPILITLCIPPNSHISQAFEGGIAFTTGISMAITNAIADADVTAVAANDVMVNLTYA